MFYTNNLLRGRANVALWLGIATLSAFGLVDVEYVASSGPNLIYLTTLVMVTIHLLVSPWLLRTIHRKGSQADEFFGAEFLSDIKNLQKGGSSDDGESDSDGDNRAAAAVKPTTTSPRGSKGPVSQRKNRPHDIGNRSPRAKASSAAMMNQLQLAMEGDSPRPARQQSVARPASPRIPTPRDVVAAPPPVESESYMDQIPFASPVFMMDAEANLSTSDFWQFWKQMETTGAFSCNFTNQPSRSDLDRHLSVQGFHVVAIEQKENVLQVYFYGAQYGTDTFFLCEFVLLFARRFFQATFKCKDRETASEFVTRFNLNAIIALE
ncbi:hypothetical protein PHYBOEH_011809 [Phytophthora boehmeriae]|uniref:Beta-adaptin appendage C-terminal subdomain domain-containing protein n=1 Tax=Phytophthora boehmeriae TaxID=109152 RepID=A0A8T1VFM8_9STRA|nr:hypothetical protein PHYBOEH_011809 [Phytophthora boehmeriae]